MFRKRLIATALALSAATLTGCSALEGAFDGIREMAGTINGFETTSPGSTKVTAGPKFNGRPAADLLEELQVRGKSAKTGYNREKMFGKAWGLDLDHSGCKSTRDDILKRDLDQVKFKDKKRCVVASGELADPYTGQSISWKVGAGTVDIDHATALENAWVSGAKDWGDANSAAAQQRRAELANDPVHLIASDASSNRAKGSKNAAEWLPKNRAFRCQYVSMQIAAKYKYRLSVTQPEKTAMNRVLSGCKGQRAPYVRQLSAL